MQIELLQLIEGARKARGLTVIIDVFRAFSTACYIIDNGADRIIPVADIQKAYQLKEENPDFILVGERGGKIQPGFDYGNSPALIRSVDFTGKTVIQTTSAGTQGLINATGAGEIITGSFVNTGAVLRYIKEKIPERVSLVSMGLAGIKPAAEDDFCAEYIKNKLEDKKVNFPKIVEQLRRGSGRRFFNPANRVWSPPEDFKLCLKLNNFNFVLQAMKTREDLIFLQKYKPRKGGGDA
ncbi:MAG TPA: 2-phosphosulfolactate phosphatase [Halanaerobiales bacterium]|nr:2-phosphosulfolactate phosphatase [Halanaerobiales bacterium]